MIRRWFALPQLEDEYEAFAARVLHYTLLLLICVAASFVFFVSSPSQLIYIPAILAVFGGCYYLLHSGHFRLASLIFVSGMWIVITLASFNINGIRNASISSYAIVIIFSAILFPDRSVVVFTGLSLLSAIILTVGETWGVLPLHTTPLYVTDRFFQQVALFGAAGILLSAASRMIRSSSIRIRRHEKTLLERNRELEAEIAERQRSEANLRISEEKYRLLFENIPVMAGVYAKDGEIILLNKAAAQTFNGTPETLQGRNLRDVFTWEDAERAIANQARVIEERKDVLSEGKTSLSDGGEFHYLRHIIPLPDMSNSSAPQVLVLTTDLTAKYQAEQRERELMLAQERNTFLTDFFSTLSHDLKTPLTVMNTSLYLLKRAATEDQREERMARISEQVVLMDKYIQDMLTISRLEHVASFNFQELDLNRLVESVIDLLRPRIEGKQISFQFNGQPNLPAIRGDEDQLRRMLTNLIENAVNYTPAGGKVTVNTQTHDNQVVLEVIDSGIGIEAEAVPHIFERFFRAANATAFERSGTGLGLAIVKKIVETHTATIDVGSKLGEGTTFSVQFSRS
ncbi:MAG: ATP-binding protein [Chloroflexota bacterium]